MKVNPTSTQRRNALCDFGVLISDKDKVLPGTFRGGDEVLPGTFRGGDEVLPGTFR